MAFDAARQEIVMFGGQAGENTDETWVWNAVTGWNRLFPAVRPSARSVSCMVAVASNRVLLFGGSVSSGPGPTDTWEWDMARRTWSRLSPATSPQPATWMDMTYDVARGRVVLVRDPGYPNPSLETWEWDGVNWTLITTALAPEQRAYFALGYDPVRGRTVLHGGYSFRPGFGYDTRRDTWLWDGTTWVQAAYGPDRKGHKLVFDAVRARLVAFGGSDSVESDEEIFQWDGNAWTGPWRGPLLGRAGHGMVFDGQQIVVFGGARGNGVLDDMWRWNGAVWTEVVDTTRPGARTEHAAAYDSLRRRHVVFGGRTQSATILGDTWLLQGSTWVAAPVASAPSPRRSHAMAYDARRDRVVLFGGASASVLGDTWEWDGSQWLQRTTPVAPSARHGHRLVWAGARGVVVLFGGRSTPDHNGAHATDTWEWNGATWIQRFPATVPPSLGHLALAHDDHRQRSVLLGWSTTTGGVTWEWDGTNWARRSPATQPSPSDFDICYDSLRQRTVALMRGGLDTWEWDGTDWAQRAASLTDPCNLPSLTFDAARGRVVLFGGEIGLVVRGGLWEYGPIRPASVTSFGAGCAGSAGTPVLSASGDSLPWIGDAFRLEGTALPTNGLGALLFLGASRTSFAGVPLPLDLTGAQMPGCFLRVSIDVALFAPVVNGVSSWSLPICACPELVGASAFTQLAGIDAAANPGGLSWSQATDNRIGGR